MTSVAMPAEDSRQVTKLEEESSVLPLRLWRVGFLGRDGVELSIVTHSTEKTTSPFPRVMLGFWAMLVLYCSMPQCLGFLATGPIDD